MKKAFIAISIFYCVDLFAQEADPIVTDRPTQSAASAVIPKGNLLVEYGFVYEKVTDDFDNITLGNFHLRYGLVEGVELRLTQNILQSKNSIIDEKESGLSPTTLGTKVHLIQENGWMPQASVIGQVTFNNGDDAFKPGSAAAEFRLNFSNTLSDKMSLGYNVGIGMPEGDNYTLYSVVLGYLVADNWTVFGEPYGFFQNGDSDHRFNAGLIYLCKNNLQFDISAGLGLSDISPDSFVGFGAAIGF